MSGARQTGVTGLRSCLDRESRLAYVLGEIIGVSTTTGAEICSTTEAAYRKRLSRARGAVRSFLETNCGLVAPTTAACHCRRRVPAAVAAGRIDPAAVLAGDQQVAAAVAEIETIYDASQLLRSRADPGAPERLTVRLVELVRSGRFPILD